MNLLTARYALLRERMDWSQTHLRWMPNSIYKLVFKPRKVA